MLKRLPVCLFLVLVACQTATRRPPPTRTPTPTSAIPENPPPTSPPPALPQLAPSTSASPVVIGGPPKIGLILGPGAMRSYAHVGVLLEVARQRLPVQAVVGFEMGALVGALYANKGMPFDVEWQLMKLKESEVVRRGLLSNSVEPGDVRSLNDFITMTLGPHRAENSKIPFGCLALQMSKSQVFMMNRGAYTEMLPYCLALPPLFKPYQQNVAAVLDLKAAIDFVRSRGATHVIYVDLLSGSVGTGSANPETQVLWSLAAQAPGLMEQGIDDVIRVPLQEFDLLDFNRRRELVQSGQKAAAEALEQISKNRGW